METLNFLEKFKKNWTSKIIILIVVVFFIVFLKQFYFIVQPWYRAFILRLGSMQEKIYDNGFYLKMPFLDKVVEMDIRVQKLQTEWDAASKDLQNIRWDIALNFALDSTQVTTIYKTIWTLKDIENRLIWPAIQESIKATTAKFTAEELITKREKVSVDMKNVLKEKLEIFGVKIIDVNIVNFSFSSEFDRAIENKVKAEQDALTEKNTLEKTKYQAQQKIEEAKWQAEATLLNAKAEAEAIKIKTEAIRVQWWADYVKLQRIAKRNWVLPATSLWSNTPVIFDMGN